MRRSRALLLALVLVVIAGAAFAIRAARPAGAGPAPSVTGIAAATATPEPRHAAPFSDGAAADLHARRARRRTDRQRHTLAHANVDACALGNVVAYPVRYAHPLRDAD